MRRETGVSDRLARVRAERMLCAALITVVLVVLGPLAFADPRCDGKDRGTPTAVRPPARPTRSLTEAEVRAQTKKAQEERVGKPGVKCETEVYGGAAAVAICE